MNDIARNMAQIEFERFWSELTFSKNCKRKYHTMFVKYKLNDIRKLWNEYDKLPNILSNQIGMNCIHLKYFIKQCWNLKVRYLEFEDWFNYLPLLNNEKNEEYLQVLINNAIYSFESFRFYIQSVAKLEKVLSTNCDCYQHEDATIIVECFMTLTQM